MSRQLDKVGRSCHVAPLQAPHSLPQRYLSLKGARQTWVQISNSETRDTESSVVPASRPLQQTELVNYFWKMLLVPPLPETSAGKAGLKPLAVAHGTQKLVQGFTLEPMPQGAWAPGRNRRPGVQVRAPRWSL